MAEQAQLVAWVEPEIHAALEANKRRSGIPLRFQIRKAVVEMLRKEGFALETINDDSAMEEEK